MTSSAPAPDQPAGPPPEYPPLAPPPMAAPSPASAVRPGMVTGAGVVMITAGALITLFGLLFLLVAGVIGGFASGSFGNDVDFQMPGLSGSMIGAAVGFVIVFALLILAVGILDIVAGINVLGGRSWARIVGIVIAAILGLFALTSLSGDTGAVLVSLVWLGANVLIIWALATSGSWFAARGS
jgi:hypothetical protein